MNNKSSKKFIKRHIVPDLLALHIHGFPIVTSTVIQNQKKSILM